eukprot:TRINITY_DN6036_c0_g1_i14.p1 TRINITY_DN6036_c0_g1~~TRINITY_DN6036_c0_g1_i14.p1  ORF type:complete len:513 (+),score=89.98 TRINITY_DN6036_c0_g1_i14:47-1540(+)
MCIRDRFNNQFEVEKVRLLQELEFCQNQNEVVLQEIHDLNRLVETHRGESNSIRNQLEQEIQKCNQLRRENESLQEQVLNGEANMEAMNITIRDLQKVLQETIRENEYLARGTNERQVQIEKLSMEIGNTQQIAKKQIEISKADTERNSRIQVDNQIRPHLEQISSLKNMLQHTDRQLKHALKRIESLGHEKADREHEIAKLQQNMTELEKRCILVKRENDRLSKLCQERLTELERSRVRCGQLEQQPPIVLERSPDPIQVKHVVEVPVERLLEVPVDKIIEVPVPKEKIVEIKVDRPVEKLVNKPKEIQVPIPVQKIVHKPIERIIEIPVDRVIEVNTQRYVEVPVNRYVDVPQRVPVPVPQEVPMRVPEPFLVEKPVGVPYPERVRQNVYLDSPVQIQVPYETVVEKEVIYERPIPIETIIEKPTLVERVIQQPQQIVQIQESPQRVHETRYEYPAQVVSRQVLGDYATVSTNINNIKNFTTPSTGLRNLSLIHI